MMTTSHRGRAVTQSVGVPESLMKAVSVREIRKVYVWSWQKANVAEGSMALQTVFSLSSVPPSGLQKKAPLQIESSPGQL
jgi:hypothetical protein